MNTNRIQGSSLLSSFLAYLKPSHRTLPEQIVGFFIFLLFSLSFFLVDYWISNRPINIGWYQNLSQIPWNLKSWFNVPIWVIYHLLIPLSMWTLWRRISLLNLKLELSLFLTQLILQTLFFLCFFIFQESLLSLFVNLFLVSNTLLCILLFRKKKKISGSLLIPGFVWIFYMMGVSMALCILRP